MRQLSQPRTIRHRRIRARVVGTVDRPRLSVFRSLRGMQAQLVDDSNSNTLIGLTDRGLETNTDIAVPAEFTGAKTQRAYRLGWLIAQKAKEQSVQQAVFDRGGYRYHGRIKAVAEGARAGGLIF